MEQLGLNTPGARSQPHGGSRERTISRKITRQKEQEDYPEKQDRKGDSNESPKIQDRDVTSNIIGLPSGSIFE